MTPVGNTICIQQYLLFLLKNHYSHAYVNQAVSALKFYTKHVLGEPLAGDAYVRPKKEAKLPNVPSLEEVRLALGNVHNLKHKAILYLTYSSGLRVSEVVRLKPGDIEVDRCLVKVRQAKGRKDRYTIFSQSALDVLQKYIEQHTPQKWLFPGQAAEKHITERTVQKMALLQSSLQKKGQSAYPTSFVRNPFA